jgi:hypothetical protein
MLGGTQAHRFPLHLVMATLPVRLFGLFLLTLAITIPSCQALFPLNTADAPQPFKPAFVRD